MRKVSAPPQSQWRWRKFSLEDLKSLRTETEFSSLRQEFPIGLITELQGLSIVLVNLLAPPERVFWACPVHDDQWADWGSGRAILRPERSLDALADDLRREVGRVSSFAVNLLGPLRTLMKQKGKIGTVQDTYARHRCIALPTADLGRLQDRLEEQIRQFGDFAFMRWADNVPVMYEPSKALADAQLVGLSPAFSGHLEQACDDLLGYFQRSISQVDAGLFDLNCLSSKAVVGGFVALTYETSLPGEVKSSLKREILSWRSRFIRLLGWPAHYATVREALHPYAIQDIRAYGITQPFDLAHELQCYLREMEAKYSVLKSSQFQ